MSPNETTNTVIRRAGNKMSRDANITVALGAGSCDGTRDGTPDGTVVATSSTRSVEATNTNDTG